MKKTIFLILLLNLLNQSVFSQTFDPCDSSIYYIARTPLPPASDRRIIQSKLIGGVMTFVAEFPVLKVGEGPVNGLGCNALDSCLYYLNRVGATTHLIRMNAFGDTMTVNSNMSYSFNGSVDACGNYIQYKNKNIIKTNISTGSVDTIFTSVSGFITDLDYNPFDCNYYLQTFGASNVIVVDTLGAIVTTLFTPDVALSGVGGIAISPEGDNIMFVRGFQYRAVNIDTDLMVESATLPFADSGPPTADMAAFQCDNVVADISDGVDTLFFRSCADSVTVNFTNYSAGILNLSEWNFGDGTPISNLLEPVHTFETNGVYEVTYLGSRYTCETCHYDETNYDTLIVVIDVDSLELGIDAINPICNGETGEGTVVSVVGGEAPYTYEWMPTGGTGATETGLIAGDYTVVVKDAGECEDTSVLTIVDPVLLMITIDDIIDENCDLDDGSISVIGTGGTGSLEYSIDGGTTWQDMPVFDGLSGGVNTIVVRDENNCMASIDATVNNIVASIDPTILALGPFCINDPAVPVLTVSPGGVFSGETIGGMFNPADAGVGTHNITYTTTTVCGDETATISVIVNGLPTISYTGDVLEGCEPHNVNFSSSVPLGSTCLWSFGDGTSAETCGLISHTYLNDGSFDVSLTVTDFNGCRNSVEFEDYINVFDIPNAAFQFSPSVLTTLDAEVSFTDLSVNAIEWEWNFGNIGNSSAQNPTFTFPSAGNYEVTLEVIGEGDCRDIATQIVTIKEELVFYVPNTFTPDGDSFNETFLPVFTSGFDVFNYHLTVFNRYGEIVFESFDASKGWDGTYGNSSIVVDGVYIWAIEFGDINSDKIFKESGHITVLK